MKGEANFFLQPGELLDTAGVQSVVVLGEEEALFASCVESFDEVLPNGRKQKRVPGERWLIFGPGEYIPPLQVITIERRKALLQLESLGLYRFYWVKAY